MATGEEAERKEEMRRWRTTLSILLATSVLASDPTTYNVTSKDVCSPGYSKKVRHVTTAMKREVFARDHVKYVLNTYRIDHVIPLCAGGANVIENLQVQTIAESLEKDKLERSLCRDVCAGRIGLDEARVKISDWKDGKK